MSFDVALRLDMGKLESTRMFVSPRCGAMQFVCHVWREPGSEIRLAEARARRELGSLRMLQRTSIHGSAPSYTTCH